MALLILKKKLVSEEAVPVISTFGDKIDEVGRLMAEAAPILKKMKELQEKLKPLKKAEEELKEEIEALEVSDDVVGHEELGTEYKLEVNERGSSREIADMKKAKELLGDDLFFQLAKVNLTDLDNYLTLPQRDKVLKTNRTAHKFKIVKR